MDTPNKPRTHSLLVLSKPIANTAQEQGGQIDPELIARLKRLREWLARKETA